MNRTNHATPDPLRLGTRGLDPSRASLTPRAIARSTLVQILLLGSVFACGVSDSTANDAPSPPRSTTLPAQAASSTVAATTDATVTSTSTSATSAPNDEGESVPSEPDRIKLPVAPGSTVEGLIDVGGHDIYARCAGQGAPTIVYFAGWGQSEQSIPTARGLEDQLGLEFRLCSYERRNTGRSEIVGGTQSPEDVISDIDGLLDGLDEAGPFILVGSSFGGQIASLYAVAHPELVAGLLLIDASTGVDHDIDEQHGFQGMCLPANRQADAWESPEKLDNCSLGEWIRNHRDQEPDVPLLYLASSDPSTRGGVADDPTRKTWVESWSPGIWREVDAPHWMDISHPAMVADAVREVIDLAS